VQLRQLEYLVALAREQHFARAAASCRVSQPALSESLRRLERELGVTLIERDHAFRRMTPAGLRVVDWAQRMLANEQAMHDDVAAMRSQLAGVLRIAAVPTAITQVPRIVRPFTAAHPLASVEVHADLSATEILEGLGTFELDAGISYLGDLPAGFVAVPLYREHFAVALEADTVDPIWLTEGYPPELLVRLDLVLLSRRNLWRRTVDTALARRGVTLTPRVETSSVAVLYAHVVDGGLAAIVSREWADLLVLPPRFTLVPLDLGVAPALGLVVRQERPGTPIVAAAVAAAKHAAHG
jgi:DNA-binding transcriptional LysR family regulator